MPTTKPTTKTFKGFIQMDDLKSSKTRKKMNVSDPKKREYAAFESAELIIASEGIAPPSSSVPLVWRANATITNRVSKVSSEEEEVTDATMGSDDDYFAGLDTVDDSEDPGINIDDTLSVDTNGGADDPEGDPNKQGLIRVVKGAHLVFKRQNPDGGYDELWIYNLDNAKKDELDIRRDILSGTDIPTNKTKSADGSQSYSIWTSGNAQLVSIVGLPN